MTPPSPSELQQQIQLLQAELQSLRAENQSLRANAEKALEESQKQNDFLAKIIRDAAQPMAIGYPDGRLGIVNRAFEELTGYTAEEVQSLGWIALTPPEWHQMEAEKLAEQDRTGLPMRYEKEYLRKDGTRIPIELLVHRVPDANGNADYYYSFVTDITQRKQADLAVQESQNQNEFLAKLVRDASQPLAIAYPNGGIGLVNKAFEALTGYNNDELRSVGRGPLTPPEYKEFERAKLNQLRQPGTSVRYEKEYIRKDGTRVPVELLVNFVAPSDGQPEYYYTFVTDITERRRTAEVLARAKEAAENASAAKDQFLAVLSHELRTPLAPVRMALSMWERHKHQLPAEFREELSMIRRNVDLERRLIDDMLDLNRIAHGKLELQLAPIDLNEEIRHACRTVESDAMAKHIALAFDPAAQSALVSGDAGRIQQVLWNVLKNAVKFTHPHGSVSVRTYNTPDHQVCVEVRDTGVGIESQVLNRIFNAFEQGNLAVTRSFGGLGLGLSISRALVQLHGGSLEAHSDGKDRGATFTLKLKTAPQPGANTANDHAAPPAVGISHDRRDPLLRILLVEDHNDTAKVMQRLLRSFGYNVHTAATAQQAIDAARAHVFDLMISDIGLPDGSGYDLLRQILAHRPIKAIALTGYGMERDVQQGQDAGFAAHLTKPINIEQLESTIRRVLKDDAPCAPS